MTKTTVRTNRSRRSPYKGWLTPETSRKLVNVSKAMDMSVSNFISRAVERSLKEVSEALRV